MSKPLLDLSTLPDTLSGRLQALREHSDLTQRQLAQRAQVTLQVVEDIEAGLDVFLAPSMRQKLARALKVPPKWLQVVEKQPEDMAQAPKANVSTVAQLIDYVAHRPKEVIYCPLCQSELVVQWFERLDIDDTPLVEVKIHCSSCLFRCQETRLALMPEDA